MNIRPSTKFSQSPIANSVLPSFYRGPVIRGAKVSSLCNKDQEIIFQEICHDEYSIRFISGNSSDKFELNKQINEGLFSFHAVKNGFNSGCIESKTINLQENHYLVNYNSSCYGPIVTNDKEEFQFLEIFYPLTMVQQLSAFSPNLNQIVESKGERLLGNKTFWTSPVIREILNRLLYYEYADYLQTLYFGLKIREILFHLLQYIFSFNDDDFEISAYEVNRIYEAKTILESHIDKKPPTIRQLSRMVAINEFKLKRGFRKIFQSGIFTWITKEKMYRARRLLEETNKPIKEIAALTGYPRTTNFITAFRKEFGITPGAIRRSKS